MAYNYAYTDTDSIKTILNANFGILTQKGLYMTNNTFVIHENGKAVILNKAMIVSIEQGTGKQCTIHTVNADIEYNPDESYRVVVRRFFS